MNEPMTIPHLTYERAIVPDDVRRTHVLNREYYRGGRMQIKITRYEDGSYTVDAPIKLTWAQLQAIDWSVNVWGYILDYPNGELRGQYRSSARDFTEVNPFAFLLED